MDSSNARKRKISLLYKFLCYIYFSLYGFLVVSYNMGAKESEIRYIFLAIITAVMYISYCFRRKTLKKNKALLLIITTAAVFYAVSIILCVKQSVALPFRVYVQTSLFLLPAIFAYLLTSIMDKAEVLGMLKIVTIIGVVGYFLEPRHTPLQFLNPDNYKDIDLLHSRTFTESSHFSEFFTQLFVIFNYYADREESNRLKKYKYISLVFALLSFKRLSVLFIILLLLANNRKINLRTSIKRNKLTIAIMTSVVALLTVGYTLLLQGKIANFGYNNIFDLTSGRNWILSRWGEYNYKSYGYGSSMIFIDKYLELDLVQIFLELGLLPLILFIFSFSAQSRNKYYKLVTLYVLGNMLTASTLPWINGTLIFFIGLYLTNNENGMVKESHGGNAINKIMIEGHR